MVGNNMSTTTVNPFLAGNFAPVQNEITADELTVIGELPQDLSGMFVRNGPNPQFPSSANYHWFGGDGMLHGVQISNGKASYRDRYVRTPRFEKERETGQALEGLTASVQNQESSPSLTNRANTSVIWHSDHFLALYEGGEPYGIKLPELETIGAYTFEDKLASAFTAHPKIDPVTGEMMFFGYSPQPPFLTYSIVSRSGELVRTVPIDLPEPVMMHDFAITQDYTLFMDLPMVFNPQGEAMLQFKSERPSRFGIVPRHGDNSSIRWFESPSCYAFHILNAYQEGDEVVLIACRMSSCTVLTALEETGGDPDSNKPRLYQWRFNLRTGNVQEKPLDERISDFPRINEQLMGRKMRYGYTAKMADNPMPLFEGVIKYDFDNGTSQVHHYGAGRYGGEAVFAPRPNGTAEDDGWLITFVHDHNSDTSELVVLNAQDLTAEPVARVLMPQRVPYGFHGTWVSQEQLIHSI
ncbi:Retinal pigment epithelial membrane protein [Coleofasciculus chthonoplastes PCC 7420]|uniref:Retinal pigment epithelial membrane protein n=2 Tax=Coleofasciculus chthonoplastes TaxID=64178 RepID=B4VL27_9CYAN|nr:Retinal pigment epithelial membrane protein [Coleofasciculus chthonoplastes PCC 7420]